MPEVKGLNLRPVNRRVVKFSASVATAQYVHFTGVVSCSLSLRGIGFGCICLIRLDVRMRCISQSGYCGSLVCLGREENGAHRLPLPHVP